MDEKACRAMGSETEDGLTVIGYMDRTDWECEIGMAPRNSIYESVEALKEHRKGCVQACGIVEVSVTFKRLVEPGTDNS